MESRAAVELLQSKVGEEIGVSDWFRVDQKRIDQFAECTQDTEWIHVDPRRAAEGPFGRTIAHGFLILSLIPAMVRSVRRPLDPAGVQTVLNYGMNKVRFIAPVPVDSEVRSRMVLTAVAEKEPGRILVTTTHQIEIKGQPELACVVEIIGLYILN